MRDIFLPKLKIKKIPYKYLLKLKKPKVKQEHLNSSLAQKNKWHPLRGSLWWRIWLALFAGIVIYSVCTVAYIRIVVSPRIEAKEQALRTAREEHIAEFKDYMQKRQQEYQEQLENWRYHTPDGTPAPIFAPPFSQDRNNIPQPPYPKPPERNKKSQNPISPIAWFMLMLIMMGAVTYPIARKLTKRLEKLQHSVEEFGSGNLQTRVDIQGDDEVGKLAKSFNASAQQIEKLLQQHKQLLAQVSHELRTPLTRLSLCAEMISQSAPQIAKDLRTDIKELDNMVEEILLASRLDAVPDLLQISSFDALGLAAEEASRTGAELHGESIEMLADETLIRRALRNLLINAQRHAPGTPAQLVVSYEKAHSTTPAQVCFGITDHGPGISPDDREHIFEPFFRAKNTTAKGTGLGLSLVQQIAQRHGGKASCLDAPGGGCHFELRIPVSPC